MPTKDELAADAIAKTQKLELEFAQAKAEVASLQSHVDDLKKSDKEQQALLQSLLTLKWIGQYVLLPVLLLVGSAALTGLFWAGRLAQRVDILEQKVQRAEERLESTRDRILILQKKVSGTISAATPNSVTVGWEGRETAYQLSPTVLVQINEREASIQDLRPGMRVVCDVGLSIDNRPFLTRITVTQ